MSDRPNPRDARDAAEFVRRLKSIDASREPRDARREPPKSTSPLSVAWRRLAENGPWSFAVAVAAVGSVAVVAGEAGSDTAAAFVAAVAAMFTAVVEFLATNPIFTAIAGWILLVALVWNAFRDTRREGRAMKNRRRFDLVSISATLDYRIRSTFNPDEWSRKTRMRARNIGVVVTCICIAGGFAGFIKAGGVGIGLPAASSNSEWSIFRGLAWEVGSALSDPTTMVAIVASVFGLTGIIVAIRIAGR